MKLDGILFFPVTPFDTDGRLNPLALEKHVQNGLEHKPGAVFVAGGAGEFHALGPEEYSDVVSCTTGVVAGEVPVIAGSGGSLSQALDCVRRANECGADGVLLLPPYLVTGGADGLVSYVEAVADSSELPVIFYQRDGATLTPQAAVRLARHPRVAGIKDGTGDFDRLMRILLAVRAETGDETLFFNGMPTAELTVPAYRGVGINLYSSAAFSFAPRVAAAFYTSMFEGDGVIAHRLLAEFYAPIVELRDQVPGYSIAMIKAAVRIGGLDVGTVRPPLVDLTPEHYRELERIIQRGLQVVS